MVLVELLYLLSGWLVHLIFLFDVVLLVWHLWFFQIHCFWPVSYLKRNYQINQNLKLTCYIRHTWFVHTFRIEWKDSNFNKGNLAIWQVYFPYNDKIPVWHMKRGLTFCTSLIRPFWGAHILFSVSRLVILKEKYTPFTMGA